MIMNKIKLMGGVRIDAIDILKFLAALLITNSHMNGLYPPKFEALATGGALGDSCFFFCSGFLLIQSRGGDFFNWYKRRVNRIFPTLFAIAIVSIVAFGKNPAFKSVILSENAWFVQAILVFYAAFWFVKRFLSDKMWGVITAVGIISLIWFAFFWDKSVSVFMVGTYLRWPLFFCVMLIGAITAKNYRQGIQHKLMISFLLFILLMGLFYGYQILEKKKMMLCNYEIVIAPILFLAVYELFWICSNERVVSFYRKKGIYAVVFFISSLCFEIYLSQHYLFPIGKSLIRLFPLNIIICFVLIVGVAYIVKVLGNFISQTFKSDNYEWKKMVKIP